VGISSRRYDPDMYLNWCTQLYFKQQQGLNYPFQREWTFSWASYRNGHKWLPFEMPRGRVRVDSCSFWILLPDAFGQKEENVR